MTKQLVNINQVDFTGGYDGVHALYIDNELVIYGDTNDNILDKLDGFKRALEWSGILISITHNKIEDPELISSVSEMNHLPSKNFLNLNI